MGTTKMSEHERKVGNAQLKLVKGDIDPDSWEARQVFAQGQTDRHPLVIDNRNKSDHVVAVLEDSIKNHPVVGAEGTSRVIVKGKCQHCGSNRLEKGCKEPAGIAYVACPVCNRDNMSRRTEFDYEVHRGEE